MHKKVTNQSQAEKNMRRVMVLRDELFELANSFAGDKYGNTAMTLHSVCNQIARVAVIIKPSILGLDRPYRPESFD